MVDRGIVVVAAALCVSPALSDLVYQASVVPRLAQWHSVTIWAWLMVFSPMLLAGFVGGAYLANSKRVVVAGMLLAAGTQLYDYVAVLNHSPGSAKSWAIEAPLLFWSVGTATNLLSAIGMLSIGLLTRRIVAMSTRFRGSAHQQGAKRVA